MNRNEHRSPEGRNTSNSGHISDIQEHEENDENDENEEHSVEDTPAHLDHRPSHPPQSHSHLQQPRDHGRLSVDDDNTNNNDSTSNHPNNDSSPYINGSTAGAGGFGHSPSKRLGEGSQKQTSPKTPLRLSTSMVGASSTFHIHDNPMSAVLPKMPTLFNNGSSSSSFVDTMTQQLSIHVEQPVGSMSISPSSRDVVLAA
jgi:hypothetical protein